MQDGRIVAGRYRLERVIGRGGMSVVWRAVDLRSGDLVAVKEQPLGRKARRAAETLAKVDHPGVARVLDHGPDWLVMEYIDGTSLSDILARVGRITPEQAARVGADVASALGAVHATGLMHRDVKPGNIMIAAGTGAVKLIDFGISRPAHNDPTATGSGLVGATPAYAAPEIADGDDPTPAADVFSLGATLFAAVEGAGVYGYGATDNPLKMLALAREREISEPRRAGALAPVLTAMLRADPARRPTPEAAGRALAEAGSGAVSLETLGSSGRGGAGRFRSVKKSSWLSRRPARVASAGGAVAVAGLVLLAFTVGPGRAGGAPRPGPTAALTIASPRTADPCSLTTVTAFTRFGDPALSTDYGNFNRCDVLVQGSGGSDVDVRVELEVPGWLAAEGWYGDPKLGQKPKPGAVTTVKSPAAGTECDRALILPDGNRVLITAEQDGTGRADLCAMADTQTQVSLTALRQTGVRPRAPLGRASLANQNACSLLDPRALDAAPGIAGSTRTEGFGDWECRWDSRSSNSYIELLFDQGDTLDSSDGQPVRLHGRTAYVQSDGDGTGTCVAQLVDRQYTDADGQATQDRVRLTFGGDGSPSQLCGSVTRLADDIALRLQSPSA